MKRIHLHLKPTKVSEFTFDDLYDEISHDWRHKAEQLQIRRWRALKHAVKGSHYVRS